MQEFSSDESALLLDLFIFQGSEPNVDPARFRLRHEKNLAKIDALIKQGFIHERMGRYSSSLIALEWVATKEVEEFLDSCDSLWLKLQSHYRNNLTDQVLLTDLAVESGLTVEVARKAMMYMIELPWYASHTLDFPAHKLAAIGPQEKVIRLDSFRQLIAEQRNLQVAHQNLILGGDLQFTIEDSVDRPKGASSNGGAPWNSKLKEPLATILAEVFGARSTGYITLAAMGVRAVLDVVCTEVVGDKPNFKKKIEAMQNLGHLSAVESSAITIAFDAGSASIHRGYLIEQRNLDNLIEIMEHLLRKQYRLDQAAQEIFNSTPARFRN